MCQDITQLNVPEVKQFILDSAPHKSHPQPTLGSASNKLQLWLPDQPHVCYYNGHSIIDDKLTKLQSYVYSSSIDVLIITETWLSDSIFKVAVKHFAHGDSIFKVAVKHFAHAINCFINTAETKLYIMLNCRYSVNNSGSW